MNITTNPKMEFTKDLTKFSFFNENRPVNEDRAFEIALSALKTNLFHAYPIVVNDKFEVLDGQHRVTAVRILQKDYPEQKWGIYFVKDNNVTVKNIGETNALTKHWPKEQWVHYYSSLGNKNYIELSSFCEKFGFTISIGILLLGGGHGVKTFNDGKFKITDRDFAEKVAEHLGQFRPYFKKYKLTCFVRAIKFLYKHPKYNPSRMIERLERQSRSITECRTEGEYVELLQDIYNYDMRHQNKVNFRKDMDEF